MKGLIELTKRPDSFSFLSLAWQSLLTRRQRRVDTTKLLDAMQSDSVSTAVCSVDVRVELPGPSRWILSGGGGNSKGVAVLLDGELVPFRASRIKVTPHPVLPSVEVMRFL